MGKKIKTKLFSSKTLSRIIFMCIILGVVPALVVGMFSYYRASNVVQDKVDETNMQLLLHIRMSTEQLLLLADQSLFNFIESPIVTDAVGKELNSSDFQTINKIESNLNGLMTYDLGIYEVNFVNFDKGWVIDDYGFHNIGNSIQKDELYALNAVPGTTFWVNEASILPGIKKDDLKSYEKEHNNQPPQPNGVILVKRFPVNSIKPYGFADLMIPYSKLSSLILSDNHLGEVMILDSDYRVLADNDSSMWNKDMSGSGYIKTLRTMNGKEGSFTANTNKKNYAVNYLKSDYNGWIYLSISSMNDITRDSKAIGWFMLFICSVITLAVIIISFIISRKMYSPIYKLYSLIAGKDPKGNIQYKMDELKQIHERVELLMKDNVQFKEQIYRQLPQLKEFFILKMALGEAGQKEIDEKIRMYGYPLPKKWMCVFVIRIDTVEGTQYKEQDLDLMTFAVNNIVGEIASDSIMLNPVVVNKSQVTIIGSDHETYEDFKNYFYSVAEMIQKETKELLNFTVSIGISQPFHEYRDVNRGYREGVDALKHQIRLGYNAIIYFHDIQPENNLRFIFPDEIEKELLNAVDTCDYEKSGEYLHLFLKETFKIELNRNEYMVSLARLLVDLIHLMQKSGGSFRRLWGNEKDLFGHLFELKTVNEIENWFRYTIINPLINLTEEVSKKYHIKIVEDVIHMVHEEYDTDLSLDECASRLNYHPSYIRKILKNEAGISFYDYLSQYRINIAKKWLSETDMKILDIAEKLRYKNPQNFIRSFRKETGTTPGKYREDSIAVS